MVVSLSLLLSLSSNLVVQRINHNYALKIQYDIKSDNQSRSQSVSQSLSCLPSHFLLPQQNKAKVCSRCGSLEKAA